LTTGVASNLNFGFPGVLRNPLFVEFPPIRFPRVLDEFQGVLARVASRGEDPLSSAWVVMLGGSNFSPACCELICCQYPGESPENPRGIPPRARYWLLERAGCAPEGLPSTAIVEETRVRCADSALWMSTVTASIRRTATLSMARCRERNMVVSALETCFLAVPWLMVKRGTQRLGV